jgi:hypothetical protein
MVHQILHAGGVETSRPEQLHRVFEHSLLIELFGTAHASN